LVGKRLNFIEGEVSSRTVATLSVMLTDDSENCAFEQQLSNIQKELHSDVCEKTCDTDRSGHYRVDQVLLKHASNQDIGESEEMQSDSSRQISDEQDLLPDTSDTSTTSSSSDTSADSDESDEFGGYTVNRVESDDGDRLAPNAAADEDQQREVTQTARRMERIRRKRLHSLLRMSSSSGDNPASGSSSPNSDESDIEAKISHLDTEATPASASISVKDSWQPLLEVLCRQMGGHRIKNRPNVTFSRRFGGSVHAASRLTLYDRHEVHNGCVNALNFNESGLVECVYLKYTKEN
jgi:hypothetical protein